jgi:L-alanine-DL-glutamate epimerase-like enolase superfamily enzyme
MNAVGGLFRQHPRRRRVSGPIRPDAEGYLAVPTAPGLGVQLNRDALKRFSK